MTQKKYFSGEWHYSHASHSYDAAFACERFDNPWNGWATPVVTREQLDALLPYEPSLSIDKSGNLVYVSPSYALDDTFVIPPDSDGLYHLIDLGWCFDEITVDQHKHHEAIK